MAAPARQFRFHVLLPRYSIFVPTESLFGVLRGALAAAFLAVVPAAGHAQPAPLPTPSVTVLSGEPYETPSGRFIRYRTPVSNWSVYSDALFAAAPNLPPCGLNHNASRSWVDIYGSSSNVRLYRFCALGRAKELNNIWFSIPESELPPLSIYVVILDRLTGRVGRSRPVPVPHVLSHVPGTRPNQGRVNAVAIDPANVAHLFAMTESGGVFETFDGLRSFRHLDRLPIIYGADVAFSPARANVVVATGQRDFSTQQGVWVSRDRGATWSRPPAANPAPGPNCDKYASGQSIAFSPGGKIIVATDCGVSFGDPTGASWTSIVIPRSVPRDHEFSAAAPTDDIILIGGAEGIRYSADAGAHWSAASGAPGEIRDIHQIAVNPEDSREVYAVGRLAPSPAVRLFLSHDSGRTWSVGPQIGDDPGACGGIPFVRVHRFGGGVRLVVSNKCFAYTLNVPRRPTGEWDYSGSWMQLANQHLDTRDVAFRADGTPWLLGSDGGLEASSDGTNFNWTAAPSSGLDALQLYEIAGHGTPDWVYYGTQDNGIGHGTLPSFDQGPDENCAVCNEGDRFSLARGVSPPSRVTFESVTKDPLHIADPQLQNVSKWTSPADAMNGPAMVSPRTYVQTAALPSGTGFKMMITPDEGATWSPIAEVTPEGPGLGDIPLTIPAASPQAFYQTIKLAGIVNGQYATGLVRFDWDTATRRYQFRRPAMTGMASLAFAQRLSSFYAAIGIDPRDPRHIIAPDAGDNRIKVSRDGGDTWTSDDALTALVTHGGELRLTDTVPGVIRSLVSMISFCPDDSRRAIVGAVNGGAYFTDDSHGQGWRPILGSENRLTAASSVYWQVGCNDAFVSTYGRGVWQVSFAQHLPPPPPPSAAEPTPAGASPGVERSPSKGKPYVQVWPTFAAPGQTLTAVVRDAPDDAVLTVDGRMAERGSSEGSVLRFSLQPPPGGWAIGLHEVLLKSSQPASAALDGTGFSIHPVDEPSPRR